MKILHTADLHIGKTINGISILEQQVQALNQIVTYLKNNKIDICIIAGDIYDRSIPSKEAMKVVDTFFNELINEIQIPTFVISGNHDSSERLSYLKTILEKNHLYIVGEEIPIQSFHFKEYAIHLCSYHDYIAIQHYYEDETIINADTALKRQLQDITLHPNKNIFVGHHFFADENTTICESERPLNIGTMNYIDVSPLEIFDYVALGHLHQAQKVKHPYICYSGSIYKLSESEINHKKSFNIVDLNTIEIEKIPFQFDKDVKKITSDFKTMLLNKDENYVFLHLTDKNVILEAMQQLSKNYPNALGIVYDNIQKNDQNFVQTDVDFQNEFNLFEKYFNYTNQKPMNDTQISILKDLTKEEQS